MRPLEKLMVLGCLIGTVPCLALNTLSVRQNSVHGSFPGYIDDAEIVIEPKAGYASTSVFLTYSDHGQFPGSNVEVVHYFDLPGGSHLDDLWLWFGDSVMQARIYELPRAQFLYDSITAFKRDPAFLKSSLGQYELHVFPVNSGGMRKIKIEYQCPFAVDGGLARIPLPLGLLQSNGATRKPVRVLLREPVAGAHDPVVRGNTTSPLDKVLDTLGYRYRYTTLTDITGSTRLDLEYPDSLGSAAAFQSDGTREGRQLFSIGISPGEFFRLPDMERGPTKAIIGLDLSGKYDPDMASFPDQLESLLGSAFVPGDSIRLLAVGAGKAESLPAAGWLEAGATTARELAARFKSGSVYAAKLREPKLRILMTDAGTNSNWDFTGLGSTVDLDRGYRHIQDALNRFSNADVIAAYGEGFEDHLDARTASLVRDSLEPFFQRGGWFLTYIDKNRSGELLASRMIKGLIIPSGFQASKLSAVPSSPVGRGFPPSIRSQTYNPLINSDDEVSVEMVDSLNRPVIISKRIGNGRLIVSGIWTAMDQEGVKKQMSTALLGLQAFNQSRQLEPLLDSLAAGAKRDQAQRVLIASNSDIPYNPSEAESLSVRFKSAAGPALPRIDGIGMLSGQNYVPTSASYQGNRYLGSGLALKLLADSSGGEYYAANTQTWPQILDGISPASSAIPVSLEVSVSPASPEWPSPFEIQMPTGQGKSRYWVGAAGAGDSVRFSFKGRFPGFDSSFERSVSFPAGKDSSAFGNGLSTVLAGEAISRMLRQTPLDTARIVALAMQNRVVTDFTAMIAFEPNDSIHFLRDPKDESNIGKEPTTALARRKGDSLDVKASWMNGDRGLRLSVFVPARGNLELTAYNLAGRRLFANRSEMPERGRYSVDGAQGLSLGSAAESMVILARFRSEQAIDGKREWVKVVRISR